MNCRWFGRKPSWPVDNTVSFRGSVTNNNGFCIGWLDLLALLLQPLLIINYNSSQSMTVQDSYIPYWITSVFPSAVTDLVLIYESVTSSAFVVHWLTLDGWTLNSYECRVKNLLRLNSRMTAPLRMSVRIRVLSDERMSLSFSIAAGPRQRTHSQVRIPQASWPHFTASDSRLSQPRSQAHVFISPRNNVAQLYPLALGLFSLPFMTRRAMVEVIRTLLHTLEGQYAKPWRINSRRTEYKTA
jgi:hypothetical protein